jgi:hypothetical protein
MAGAAVYAAAGSLDGAAGTLGEDRAERDLMTGVINIVINGALAIAFRQDDIYIFAPTVQAAHPHTYRLDCTPWTGLNNILIGVQGNANKRTPADYNLNLTGSAANAIIIDCNTYGFATGNKPAAGISIPYPDDIKRMRLFDIAFADQNGGATLYSAVPGAFVFEYSGLRGSPNISGSQWGPNVPSRPKSTLKKWLVDINVAPKDPYDTYLQHAKAAWTGLAKFFPKLPWTLHSVSASYPPALPSSTGLNDGDIEGLACNKGSAANCKHGAVIVTNLPSDFAKS